MTGSRPGAFSYILPVAALVLAAALAAWPALAPAAHGPAAPFAALLAVALLCGAAFCTVAHADLVADRVGQPFGTLVLTLSVTVIEVSVIASMMLHKGNNPTLARESVLSVLMIVNTAIVGLCLLLGGLKHREQTIQQQGVSGYLSVMIALGVMLLILPSETRAGATGTFSTVQLVYVAAIAIALYGAFLYMQTVRHREDFEGTPGTDHAGGTPGTDHAGVAPGADHASGAVSAGRFALALAMLVLSLCAVVLLSKHVAAGFEDFLAHFALEDPDAVTGALVAALVLMPEAISAVRAAARNHLQQSLNIALGSALATIALTIPAMAAISVLIGEPMVLGLDNEDRTMLLLTFVLAILSFGTGKTNALNGVVHLIVFCVYVLLLFAP